MVSGPARANRAVANPPRLLNGVTGEGSEAATLLSGGLYGAYDDVRDLVCLFFVDQVVDRPVYAKSFEIDFNPNRRVDVADSANCNPPICILVYSSCKSAFVNPTQSRDWQTCDNATMPVRTSIPCIHTPDRFAR
jgi:hypothetical protein